MVDMAWKSKNLIVVSWLLVTKRVPAGSRVMLEMGFVCAGIMSSWERGYSSSSSSELSSESESESCGGGLALGGGGAARRVCSTRAFTSRSIVCFPKDFGRKARIGSSDARSGSSIVGSLSLPVYSSSPGMGFSDIFASYRSMYRVGVV